MPLGAVSKGGREITVDQRQNRPRPNDLEEYHVASTYRAPARQQEDVLAQGWKALKASANAFRRARNKAEQERSRRGDPPGAGGFAETLDQAIVRLSRQGFVVVFRSEKQAQLMRKKRLNWLTVIGHCICTAGITLIPYLLTYARQADTIVFLTVDETGVHEA
jgi:hypothetical protein